MKFKIKVPLFWKFTIAIVFIVLLFGSINAYLIVKDIQNALEQESEKRAMNIAKTIAEQAVNYLLFEDYIAVQKLLDNTKYLDSTIVYSFILDNNNNFVAGNYQYSITSDLISANTIKSGQKKNIVIIDLKDPSGRKKIRDIALPILGGQLGFVRVGTSEEKIKRDIIITISHFWIMVGVFLLLGISGAFVFALFITRPINSIKNTSDELTLEDLGGKNIPLISIRKKFLGIFPFLFRAIDEIDLLTQKFNEMIRRLSRTYHELKNTEKKLIQSEKLATIGMISAGLAHEINNPISGIQNCLRRMKEDPLNTEQNIRYVNLMDNASKRIETVMRNLLNYTRIEDLKFERVDLEKQIENALLLLAYKLESNRIILTKEFVGKLDVLGSKNHIEQIIINLLINAIDALEEDSSKNEKTIFIRAEEQKDNVLIIIKDNGIGIKQDELNKVFEPFFTTKKVNKGTGLGLSIVYNIVNLLNGNIQVESQPGKFTTFKITLPKF